MTNKIATNCHWFLITYLELTMYQEPDYIWKIENKKGKIEVNKSVIPSCGIHHLSYSFEQFNKFRPQYAFRMTTVNIDDLQTIQCLSLTSENSLPQIFEKERPQNIQSLNQGINLTFLGKSTCRPSMVILNEFMVRTDFQIL